MLRDSIQKANQRRRNSTSSHLRTLRNPSQSAAPAAYVAGKKIKTGYATRPNLPGFNREDVLSKPQPVTMFDNVSEETIRTFLGLSYQLVNDWRSSLVAHQTA